MTDPMIKAKLAELAASAEVTRLKAERNQHWEGELSEECRRLANTALEVVRLAERRE